MIRSHLVTASLTSTACAVLLCTLLVGCDISVLLPDDGEPAPVDRIELPDGFAPEGIAVGPGETFYVGSLLSGRILRGDLRTGAYDELVAPDGAPPALGMQVDPVRGLLWVANGGAGSGTVYDAATGAVVAAFPFGGGLVNDVAVTPAAAYFTDSFVDSLYIVPLDPVASPDTFYALPLSGDYEPATAPPPGLDVPLNSNGIVATPDGDWLIVANTTTGELYRVDPGTGEATRVAVEGAEPFVFADGLVLESSWDGGDATVSRLYVLQNMLNRIAVVDLGDDLATGTLVRTITNDDLGSVQLDTPATAAASGDALYVVNANFDGYDSFAAEPDASGVSFEVVRVPVR